MAINSKVLQGGDSGGIFPGDTQLVAQGLQNTVVVEKDGAIINQGTRILNFTGDSVEVSRLGSQSTIEVTGTVGPPGPSGEDANAVAYDATRSYSAGDLAHDTGYNIYISIIDDNLGNALTDTTAWLIINSGDGNISFADTPNDGDLLGVNFTNTAGVITATVLNDSVPHPAAQVFVTSNPGTIQEGFLVDQTVTMTVSVGPSGDFSFGSIASANTNIGSTTIANNIVTLTIPAANNTPAEIVVLVDVKYTDDETGIVHTTLLDGRVTIGASFGSTLSTTKPTALTDFTILNTWTGEVTDTFTADNTGRTLYYILPTRTDGYTFKTGILFVIPTDATVIGDHTLYTISDFKDAQDGATFIYTVTEA